MYKFHSDTSNGFYPIFVQLTGDISNGHKWLRFFLAMNGIEKHIKELCNEAPNNGMTLRDEKKRSVEIQIDDKSEKFFLNAENNPNSPFNLCAKDANPLIRENKMLYEEEEEDKNKCSI